MRRWPTLSVIIETVAANGRSGPARFGCYLICRRDQVLVRGFFHGPAVTTDDAMLLDQLSRRLKLDPPLPLREFLALLFRNNWKKQEPLVGFNLASHLCRLAADWTDVASTQRRAAKRRLIRKNTPKRQSFFAGGVSLILWTSSNPKAGRQLRNGRYENRFRPRVLLKVLANGAVALGFANLGKSDRVRLDSDAGDGKSSRRRLPRRLLPLERLANAAAGRRLTDLEDACAYFDVPSPTELGPDASAQELANGCMTRADTVHLLYDLLIKRHQQLRLPIAADQVYSTAGYAKAAYDKLGITPPLDRYQGDLAGLGAAGCAAYGGWTGVGIRSIPGSPPLPARLLDAAGMYPVCAHKTGIWQLLTAETLHLEPVKPAVVERWLRQQRPDTLEIGPALNVFCRLRSNGDVLPHRIRPGTTWITTIAALTCKDSLWWPLADVVRSYFDTGRIPKIDACLQLEGRGRIPDLQPIDLPGLGRFDPNEPSSDFFLFLADGRRILESGGTPLDPREAAILGGHYKQWDNSGCSGVFFEVHPDEPTKRLRKGTVLGPDGPYDTQAHSFESCGRWFFPPFYSLVTAAGRLLLYLAIREWETHGGTVIYWDTDSVAGLATPDGGPVTIPDGDRTTTAHALSYPDVENVCRALERHSPYPADPHDAPTLFRLESEHAAAGDAQLYLHATSSKRKTPYTINNDGSPAPISPSEFALGYLTHPAHDDIDWISQGWAWAALYGPEPDWIDNAALAEHHVTRHQDIKRLNETAFPNLRPWDTIITARTERLYNRTAHSTHPLPVVVHAPNLEPEQARWFDYTTGTPLPPARVTEYAASEISSRRVLHLSSFRSILIQHIRAPERKATGPDGNPCRSSTAGRLTSTPTHTYKTEPIGRESNYTDDPTNNSPTYTVYHDPNHDTTKEHVLAILRAVARTGGGRATVAARLRLSDSGVRRYLKSGRGRSATEHRAHQTAVDKATQILDENHRRTSLHEPEALLYLAAQEVTKTRRCEGCTRPLTGSQRKWCARCRRKPRLRQLLNVDDQAGSPSS
jgi:hypothetical protein